jgi:hypothetical protein
MRSATNTFLGKEQFIQQIHEFFEALVDRDLLPADIDVQTMSKTIKYAPSDVFRCYVSGEYENIDEAIQSLKDITEFVMDAAMRR